MYSVAFHSGHQQLIRNLQRLTKQSVVVINFQETFHKRWNHGYCYDVQDENTYHFS